jgi:hypothetical protein
MPVEVANVLRRATIAGQFSPDTAALAHADLMSLRVKLFAYEPVAPRIARGATLATADPPADTRTGPDARRDPGRRLTG